MPPQESLSKINPNPQKPDAATACPHCHAWWTGLNTCHCTACHRTFTGITAFDKHRDGSHAQDARYCKEPLTAGLVPAGRNYSCWALPGTNNAWTKNHADGAA
jgi:hypothetical protein